jgi:ABC-2 type transport system permease protein
MAIGLGFDAVNGEQYRRTLSRILAQPLYRDAFLIGKFLAGFVTLGISLAALWLLVTGFGLIFLGVPPGGEEIVRSLVFLVVALSMRAFGLRWQCYCRSSFARPRPQRSSRSASGYS